MRQFFRDQFLGHLLGGQAVGHTVSRAVGGLLALTLALLLMIRIAQATWGGGSLSDFCSSNFGLRGNLSSVGS